MNESVTPQGEEAGEDLLIPLPGPLRETLRIRREELRWQFARSGGPGGQNVNKVSTKALLRWDPQAAALPPDVLARLRRLAGPWLTQEGEILITSQRFRNRRMNIEDCLEKLRDLLLTAVQRPKPRHKTRPTRASKERRLAAKRQQSQRKSGRQYRGDE
jgi:ribosome-associated protein